MNLSQIRWRAVVVMTLIAGLSCVPAVASESRFVDRLTAAEKAAIGVDKMSPEQVAALESAFGRVVSEQSEAASAKAHAEMREEVAHRDAMVAEARKELEATRSALKEKETATKESLLHKAKVLLLPGTEIEYSKLDSRLATPFKGWKRGTRFRLENGQVWEAEDGEYVTPTEPAGKPVTIVPGTLGSFFMAIEGVRQRPKVRLVSGS